MSSMKLRIRPARAQEGFALILALLSLMLLTTMGLALSNSTSVELQISSNHRWSASARYNAEAGLEYGKSLLMAVPAWSSILPVPRTLADWAPNAWDGTAQTSSTGTPLLTRATRNFENWQCDKRGYGMGYGVVFDDGSTAGPEEYRSQIGGATLNGAFTLWIRRPVMWNGGNGTGNLLQDYPQDEVIMLLAEGVAPWVPAVTGGISSSSANIAANAFSASNRSVYTIEALLTRAGAPILDQTACSTRQGQSGGSSSGGNTAGCVSLSSGRQITEATVGSNRDGTADLK